MDNNNRTVVWTIVGLIVLAVLGYWVYAANRGDNNNKEVSFITNFEECEAAGYPVSESLPRRCTTPEGVSYTEELGPGEVEGAGTVSGDADLDLDNLSK